MRRFNKKSPAGIEYAGCAGITKICVAGIFRLLQFGDQITLARILSSPPKGRGSKSHCFLLTINNGDLIAVKSGFSSGYLGTGPHGFSFVLQLLDAHGVEIEEYDVSDDFIERLDTSSLTRGDIESIEAAQEILPTRWCGYVSQHDWERKEAGESWQEFPPVIPWAIIDSRITDLALKFFQHPDDCLLTGYRRLEDILRKRSGIDEHGVKLFSEAFHGEKAKLGWKKLGDNERTGRANLFTGAYMAYRNPRAHKELEHRINEQLMEFLLLNQLYCLERDAIKQPKRKRVVKAVPAKVATAASSGAKSL
jgi:hypothetical protein